ncbi:hypothetical protein [[Acholeplasma] multilocale]|uniref:hypothetical protein n=1 Tax=[Acholeplasma] multilocale TaxID=264638 RepID=UPI000479A69B|nr:hypothetical protein [[Acholeplasma] multilocale]
MDTIEFNSDYYESFNDYNDLMVQAFGIGCSLCESPEITFVHKGHPTPIGMLIKEQGKDLSDKEVEKLIAKPLEEWQIFDDSNSDESIATFLCDECFNTLENN